jgi:Zn-dependent protease with chaperone function
MTAISALLLLSSLFVSAADTPVPAEPVVAGEELVRVPEPSAKAMDYYQSGNVLWVVATLWWLAVPALFLFTGFSAGLRNLAQRVTHRWCGALPLYFIAFSLLVYVLNWPLSYYAGFIRQHAYGLSTQSFTDWQKDSLKALAVSLVFGCCLLWIPYWLLRKAPNRWWLYCTFAYVPIAFVIALIVPVVVDPLYHHFGEMKDKKLEQKILALADRAGIDGTRVYEVDMSNETKAINAYVTGFLGTKRIVLWDTAIARLNERELLTVVGHEMGHYVLNHVAIGILLSSLGVLVLLWGIDRLGAVFLSRYQAAFGFSQLADIASFPLLLLLARLLLFAGDPAGLAVSRHFEHEADRFGLEITKDNHAMARAFVKMEDTNLGNPWPGLLYKVWRSTHPPVGERIDFANHYRPWETGEPLCYEHLFRPLSRVDRAP